MKKRYILFMMMALSQLAKAQHALSDSTFKQKKLSKTSIELAFSYYQQDGNNSAVTGGVGTEKLSVYAVGTNIQHQFKQYNTLTTNFGVDIISSASTDKIDYRVSSASVLDQHVHTNIDYQRQIKNTNVKLGGSIGLGFESDYLAVPMQINCAYTEPSKMRSFQIGFAASFDDLRWGRFNEEHQLKLVYPSELRYKDWYDTYKRKTIQLKFGFSQVINKKMLIGLYPEIIYQSGLLATPFHRVYFADNSLRVENLPKQRFRFPIAIKLHSFIGKRFILKTQYHFYIDNFGIIANAIELESVVKIIPQLSFAPFFRFYHQTAAYYFKPYMQHTIDEIFYSSDYDLSKFNSYKAGAGFTFYPINKKQKKANIEHVSLRYAYYYRSSKLQAHSISFAVMLAAENSKNKKSQNRDGK